MDTHANKYMASCSLGSDDWKGYDHASTSKLHVSSGEGTNQPAGSIQVRHVEADEGARYEVSQLEHSKVYNPQGKSPKHSHTTPNQDYSAHNAVQSEAQVCSLPIEHHRWRVTRILRVAFGKRSQGPDKDDSVISRMKLESSSTQFTVSE